jgi:hypothetical protein
VSDPEVVVLLCGADGDAVSESVMTLRGAGGRVAVMVGDLSDPEVETAALAMGAELFAQAVVVRAVSDAGSK